MRHWKYEEMCECQGNPLARVTLALGLAYPCKQDLILWLENNIAHDILKYINENTTYTNHKPTLTQ